MSDFDPWRNPTTVVPPVPAADESMQNPVMFSTKLFKKPYRELTPEYYKWRLRLIEQCTRMAVLNETSLTVAAQEDYYQ